jgi:hypothetical protein
MTESNLPIVVEIDLKESDLQRANFWFSLTSWSNRVMLIFMPIVGLLLFWRVDFSTIFETPLAAIGSVVLLGFPILYYTTLWLQAKRGFRNLQTFQTKVCYSFSSEGYKVNDLKTSADVSWDAILRAAESKHSFNLFFHRSHFHTIPKRCFKHPEDIVRLRALLKQTLGARATVS